MACAAGLACSCRTEVGAAPLSGDRSRLASSRRCAGSHCANGDLTTSRISSFESGVGPSAHIDCHRRYGLVALPAPRCASSPQRVAPSFTCLRRGIMDHQYSGLRLMVLAIGCRWTTCPGTKGCALKRCFSVSAADGQSSLEEESGPTKLESGFHRLPVSCV